MPHWEQNEIKHRKPCYLCLRSLTLSWRRSLSYRNQSTDLYRKSMDWFLYGRDLRHERVNLYILQSPTQFSILMINLFLANAPILYLLKTLSINPTKWSKTLKQFVGKLPTNC